MARFTQKERFLASFLSSFPKLKGKIKVLYIRVNSIIYRKNYKQRLHISQIKKINLIEPLSPSNETFFGYYDKSPENKIGDVIFNETTAPTSKNPTSNKEIWIKIVNLISHNIEIAGDSFSYNWQQGCRAQWINDDLLIYNIFDQRRYKAIVVNPRTHNVHRTYDYPIQDGYKMQYYLSINYERIMALRPDYGYRNNPLLTETELRSTNNDGIWKVDYQTGAALLILDLNTITAISPKSIFATSLHKVNHIMISPNGEQFIFIHRWYEGKIRHDRLMLYDFKTLRVIADENMVSHMCWINDHTLFGYLRHDAKDGFFFIDIHSMTFTPCNALNKLGNGDGHPSCHDEWIVVDTYPDKSRMQHLFLYNFKTNKIYQILEVYQNVKFQGESRCDLHPRFSPHGNRIYFDTVYTGKRRLAFIDIDLSKLS